MHTVEVGSRRLAFTDVGPRDAPAIMFGPGLFFGGWMFDPQIEALSSRYRCVTVEWRGQAIVAHDGDVSMDSLTDDVVDLIEALEIGPVHWVGLSMGGFVGLRLGARHPDLVRSLTLMNTTDQPLRDRKQIMAFRQLAYGQYVLSAGKIVDLAKSVMFGPTFLRDPASAVVLAKWAESLRSRNRSGARRAALAVATRRSVADETPTITAPTLVISGTDDTAIGADETRSLAERIAGARLVVLERCGHISSLERPDAVTDLLRDFVPGVDT
ncbi:alpha/beta fold hydrolase [Gordonia sp. NPDC003376]